jgi:hypothetical protein
VWGDERLDFRLVWTGHGGLLAWNVPTVHIYRLPGGPIIIVDPDAGEGGSAMSAAFE